MMRAKPILLAVALTLAAGPVAAQTAAPTAGGANCTTLITTAAAAANTRIAANNAAFQLPPALSGLTCLNNIFGQGLNLINTMTNPTSFLQNIEQQICARISSTINQFMAPLRQCGVTITGFNMGFMGGGIGSGFSCPHITIGGGGPQIGFIGIGSGVSGTGTLPSGYTMTRAMGLW